jgi:hypothetical protein
MGVLVIELAKQRMKREILFYKFFLRCPKNKASFLDNTSRKNILFY